MKTAHKSIICFPHSSATTPQSTLRSKVKNIIAPWQAASDKTNCRLVARVFIYYLVLNRRPYFNVVNKQRAATALQSNGVSCLTSLGALTSEILN